MTAKILVAYASISGSTREVAEAIGVELEKHATVEVYAARDVTSIDDYAAVVIGSSIRVGRWLPDALRFLEKHAAAMQQKQVAYFTTCLTIAQDTEDNRRKVLAYLEPVLQIVPEVEPVGLGLFAGSLEPHHRVRLPVTDELGTDFRDWGAIETWAREIAPLLLTDVAPADGAAPSRRVLSGAVLSYVDMAGADLRDADLREATLKHTRLMTSDLRQANLRKADLTEADLSDADLVEAGLYWAILRDAKLQGADLTRANLIGADLTHADLRGTICRQAIFNGAVLKGANLRGADLSGADFNWCDLSGAEMEDANLSAANLSWANLSYANLGGARFDGAFYNDHTQWPADFSPEEAGAIYLRQPF